MVQVRRPVLVLEQLPFHMELRQVLRIGQRELERHTGLVVAVHMVEEVGVEEEGVVLHKHMVVVVEVHKNISCLTCGLLI